MQQNPIRRTMRFIILSVGFVLFVVVAFRSAHQVSDPRFTKGKPFLFARHQTTTLSSRAMVAMVQAESKAEAADSVVRTTPASVNRASATSHEHAASNAQPKKQPVAVAASEDSVAAAQSQKSVMADSVHSKAKD